MIEKAPMSEVLERFMKEFFPFDHFLEMGFFTEEMRDDYQAQADKVCHFLGYETVFEYGAKPIRCHISYDPEHMPEDAKFITEIPGIYDD